MVYDDVIQLLSFLCVLIKLQDFWKIWELFGEHAIKDYFFVSNAKITAIFKIFNTNDDKYLETVLLLSSL